MYDCKSVHQIIVYKRLIFKVLQPIDVMCTVMVTIGMGLVVLPLQVWADGGSTENRRVAESARYWTAERLRNAVPMPLPRPTKALPHIAEESLPTASPMGAEGRGPTVRTRPDE